MPPACLGAVVGKRRRLAVAGVHGGDIHDLAVASCGHQQSGRAGQVLLHAVEDLIVTVKVGHVEGAGRDPLGGRRGLDVGGGDTEPVIAQPLRDGAADPVRRPGHHGDHRSGLYG